MSERGSFVTEYIYCPECFKAAKEVLLGNEKYLDSQVIKEAWPGEDNKEFPIIAGKVGGLHSGEEWITFEANLIPNLEEKICHPMRIAVLPEATRMGDYGSTIFTLTPKMQNTPE